MICPFCKTDSDKVVDSRAADGGFAIRRRRECLACGKRFTTYERIGDVPLRVIKKDGSRVPFDRAKLLDGILKACEKRPVPTNLLEGLVEEVEREACKKPDNEIPSREIGELVMTRLREIDHVAYVRFASVYREFKDVNQFLAELRPLLHTTDASRT
ncbi:MAG: transcriptional regulator NrdR [Planctomycetota bacterium]